MKGFAISVLLLVLSSSTFCQVNLVLNGDFEAHSYCPRGWDEIGVCPYWSGIDSLVSGNCDVPDYCNACAPIASNVNVPQGFFYFQYPHSGNAFYICVFRFVERGIESNFWRVYLQGRLRKKLTMGKRYCVSFWVNLAEGSKYAIKELSAYLDNGSIDTTTQCGAPQTQCTPQITWSGSPITDSANWIKVEGSFIANGTERFITIGNYEDSSHITVLTLPDNSYNSGFPFNTFYLVDDVSVVESDTKADAGPDRHIGYGDSVYIGRPSSEAIWCDWRVLGFPTIIGSGPGIWVKPTVTTSYVMSQTLCGYTTTDTVKVFVGETGVASVGAADVRQYLLMPNPNDGNITLLQKLADSEPVSIKVYNTVGAVVHASNIVFEGNAAELNLSNIPVGVYYMKLLDKSGVSYSLQFVKK
jgi:hypothetical protein